MQRCPSICANCIQSPPPIPPPIPQPPPITSVGFRRKKSIHNSSKVHFIEDLMCPMHEIVSSRMWNCGLFSEMPIRMYTGNPRVEENFYQSNLVRRNKRSSWFNSWWNDSTLSTDQYRKRVRTKGIDEHTRAHSWTVTQWYRHAWHWWRSYSNGSWEFRSIANIIQKIGLKFSFQSRLPVLHARVFVLHNATVLSVRFVRQHAEK